MLRQTSDPAAGAMYLQVSLDPVATTVEVDHNLYVDLAADGSPVGLELLGVRMARPFITDLAVAAALADYRFPADAQLLMRAAYPAAQEHPAVTASHYIEAVPA